MCRMLYRSTLQLSRCLTSLVPVCHRHMHQCKRAARYTGNRIGCGAVVRESAMATFYTNRRTISRAHKLRRMLCFVQQRYAQQPTLPAPTATLTNSVLVLPAADPRSGIRPMPGQGSFFDPRFVLCRCVKASHALTRDVRSRRVLGIGYWTAR